jgi:formamidopyrimidine-DNA glycosylase
MKIVNLVEYSKIASRYGVEPLSQEFNLKKLKEILVKRPNLKIKQLLMMQELIAGIGNIYADECLYESRISPLRAAKSLKPPEILKLHQTIIRLLKQAIKLGGTSVKTFVSSSGEKGDFVKKLQVYQRGKEKCYNCRSPLERIKIGGRGTVYCPKCQK